MKKTLTIFTIILILISSFNTFSSLGFKMKIASGDNDNSEILLETICFNHDENNHITDAITLYDDYDSRIYYEYIHNRDDSTITSYPVAYVKSTEDVTIEVNFHSETLDSATIKLSGTFYGSDVQQVDFLYYEATVYFYVGSIPNPDEIKVHNVEWAWEYKLPGENSWTQFDTTTHTILSTNEPTADKVYMKLANWTTHWCEGLEDDKEIVDAIFDGFNKTEVLKYGKYPNLHKTYEILDSGFGMCNGLSHVFQDACGTQGMEVYRFWVKLSKCMGPPPSTEWATNGIVSLSPGLGRSWDDGELFSQTSPPGDGEDSWLFIDKKTSYDFPCNFSGYQKYDVLLFASVYYNHGNPYSDEDDVNYVKEIDGQKIAYHFPVGDGHAINLLEYNNSVHLYDLSFRKRVDNVFDSLPEGGKFPKGGNFTDAEWKDFRRKYHDDTIDYFVDVLSFIGESRSTPITNPYKEAPYFCFKTSLYDESWPSPYKIYLFSPPDESNKDKEYRTHVKGGVSSFLRLLLLRFLSSNVANYDALDFSKEVFKKTILSI